MKKYIALVLVAVLVLWIFTGCGNKGNKETESQTGEKATESVNSTEKIAEQQAVERADSNSDYVFVNGKMIKNEANTKSIEKTGK